MDINAVSRALTALNMMYQSHTFCLGIVSGLRESGWRHKALMLYFRRQSLRRKCQALVEHDRILNGG